MELAGLEALIAVAESKSFTRAARSLNVTPSAISQTVRALEERVGVRLLQRTTRSVGLTEAGARFVARLRPALDDIDAAFASLDELRDRPAGLLRLNVPRIASAHFIEPVLAEFLAEYPEIDVEMIVDDRLADIVGEGCDAGIRLGETLDKEMIAVRLTKEVSSAIVGSPAYFARHKKPKVPRDLLAHDCIRTRRLTAGDIYRWELTENGKDIEISVSGRLITNDADVMVNAALDGIGLAHLIDRMVKPYLDEKRLIRVLQAYCPPFPGFFLYYPSRAQVPLKLQALISFLRRRFAV